MKKLILSAALVAVSLTSFAQVGVGTNSPEGALDVVSTDSGFLMPRMADETAVTTPVEGMQVYNTTTKKVMLYDGTQWVEASGSAGKFVDGTDPLDAVYPGGNVAIGTTDPSGNTLRVIDNDGGASFALFSSVGGSANIEIGSENAPFAFTDYIADPTYTDYGLRVMRTSGGHSFINHKGTGELRIGAEDAANIKFRTQNTDRLTINSTGNVGIGTTTPEGALDVVSTDSGFLMPRMADETAVTTPVEGMQVYNTTTKKVMLYDGTQWVEASGSAGKWVEDVDGNVVLDMSTSLNNVKYTTTGKRVISNTLVNDYYYDEDSNSVITEALPSEYNDNSVMNYLAKNSSIVDTDSPLRNTNNTLYVEDDFTATDEIISNSTALKISPTNTQTYDYISGSNVDVSDLGSGYKTNLYGISSSVTKTNGSSLGISVLNATAKTKLNANVTNSIRAINGNSLKDDSSVTAQLTGISIVTDNRGTGNVSNIQVAGNFLSRISSSGNSTAMYGVRSITNSTSTGTGTITNAYVYHGDELINTATTLVNSYGLYLGNINSGSTLNYAIYTNAGKVRFGDDVETTGSLKVVGLVEYADNAAATTAGLTAGDFYRTADGTVKVVF